MTRFVFVDVDTQRDFIERDGTLSIAGVEAIRPNLAALTELARTRGIPVLATACAHRPDDPDPEPFPLHCLVGTPGQARIAETAWPNSTIVSIDEFGDLSGPLPDHLTLEKRRYDLFSHPAADRIVRRYAESDPTFVVYGVATDYCVRAAVLGLLERGCRVVVVRDAIRAVDEHNAKNHLDEWVVAGARLATADDVRAAFETNADQYREGTKRESAERLWFDPLREK